MRFGGIAAAKDRPSPFVDESDLVIIFAPAPEIGAIPIVHQREDAAADGDPRLASMACLLPGGAIGPDLGSLLHMESLAGFVVLECRALQVHPEFCGPDRRGVGAGAPPNPVAQTIGMGFQTQQAGRVWKHGSWIRLGEALAAQQVEKDLRMTPSHVCVTLTLGWLITKISPSVDHLFGRASADAQLQTSASDEIGGPGVLGHIEWVLVAHVDHCRADLDAAGFHADGREERERRSKLAGEVMDPEIGAVGAQLLSRDGEVDGLQEHVRRRAGL